MNLKTGKSVICIIMCCMSCIAFGGSDNTMSERYVGIVAEIVDEGSDKPLEFGFHVHAMILYIPRDHPHYKKWRALLEKSLKDGVKLEFEYSVEGQVLTYLKKAK